MPKTVDLGNLADNWPSPIVPRNRVGDFSGGVLSPRHLANLDSQGLGPLGRFKIGRKTVYSVESLISWMEERSEQK